MKRGLLPSSPLIHIMRHAKNSSLKGPQPSCLSSFFASISPDLFAHNCRQRPRLGDIWPHRINLVPSLSLSLSPEAAASLCRDIIVLVVEAEAVKDAVGRGTAAAVALH